MPHRFISLFLESKATLRLGISWIVFASLFISIPSCQSCPECIHCNGMNDLSFEANLNLWAARTRQQLERTTAVLDGDPRLRADLIFCMLKSDYQLRMVYHRLKTDFIYVGLLANEDIIAKKIKAPFPMSSDLYAQRNEWLDALEKYFKKVGQPNL